MTKEKIIETIQAICHENIPEHLLDPTWTALIAVTDDGSEFSEWLKSQGYVFNMPDYLTETEIKNRKIQKWGWLTIWW